MIIIYNQYVQDVPLPLRGAGHRLSPPPPSLSVLMINIYIYIYMCVCVCVCVCRMYLFLCGVLGIASAYALIGITQATIYI